MGKDESWIAEALATELEKFSDEPRELLSQETISLKPYRSLFQDTSNSPKKLSKSQHSQRCRVKNLLSDILKVVGQEPCVLCMLAGSITKWTMVDHRRAISVIQIWWRTVLCPAGLSSIARGVCEGCGISAPVSATSQKRARDIGDDGDMDSRTAGALIEPLNELPDSHRGDESRLTGKVYKLTANDAMAGVAEDASIWLTVPYDTQSSRSFITIEVSEAVTRSLTQKRPRMM